MTAPDAPPAARAGLRRRERAVWLTAAIGLVVILGLVAFEMLRPRDFYTGTNGAGSSGPAVHVPAGAQLCVSALDVPAGTARLRVRAAPTAQTAVAAQGAVGATTTPSTLTLPASAGPPGSAPTVLELPIARRRDHRASTPGRLCLTPAGPLDVAGRGGIQGNQVAPTINGHPVGARVAVWYLPPAGEQRSLLRQLPNMFRRAALFRPGVVGPWTYAALLLVLPPLLWAASLVLLARSVGGRELTATAAMVGVIGFLAAGSWALITPPLNAPDELEHMAFAQSVAEQGRAPDRHRTARRSYSSEAEVAYEGADIAGEYRQRDGRPRWLAVDEERWERRQASTRASPADGGGWTTVADYMPAYYALLAPAYLVTDDASIWSRITMMRLASAALGGLAAALVVMLVRELLPRHRWLAVVAGLLVAFQPMFSFMSGAINNDAGVIAAAALALFLVVRALRRGLTVPLGLGLGAAAGAMPMLKGNGLFLLPAIVLGLLGVLVRARRSGASVEPGFVAVAGGVAAASVACVLVALALHGNPDPTRPGWGTAVGNAYPTVPGAAVEPASAIRHPVAFGEYLWETFLPKLPGMHDQRLGPQRIPAYQAYVVTGWAAFGFAIITFPRWVYALIICAMLAVVALGVRARARYRWAISSSAWELTVLVTAVAGVILGTEAAYFVPETMGIPEFGRYLFPALPALAALVSAAFLGAGPRAMIPVATTYVMASLGLHWASQLLTMSSLYT